MQNQSPLMPNKFIIKEGSQKIHQNFPQPHQKKTNIQRVQITSNLNRNQIINNQKPIFHNQIENFSKPNQKQEFLLPREPQQQQVTNDNNQQQINQYYNNQNIQIEQELQRQKRISSQPPNPKIKIIQQNQNGNNNYQIRNQNTNNQNPYYQKQNISGPNLNQEFPSPQEIYWQHVSNDKIHQQQNFNQNNNQNFEYEQGQQRQIRVSSQPIHPKINQKIKIINQIKNGELIQYNPQKIGDTIKQNMEIQKLLQQQIKGNVNVNNNSQSQPIKPSSAYKREIKLQSSQKQVRQETPLQQDLDESFQSVMRTQYFKCIHCNQEISSNSFNLQCQHSYHISCFKEFIQFQVQQKDRIKLQCHCNQYISLKVIRQIQPKLVDLMLKKQLEIIQINSLSKLLKCNSCDFFCFSKNKKINLPCPYCQDQIQFPAIRLK